MKVVQWTQFLTVMGLVGMMTWSAGSLAFYAFRDGLAWLAGPLALGAVLFACIMIRGIAVALFGEPIVEQQLAGEQLTKEQPED